MNTRETLILNVLRFKQTNQGAGNQALVDQILEQNPEKADEITRNVCARISLPLFEKLNTYCDLLGLSKRDVINMALADFFDKADDVMREFDAFVEA
jgi:hypothetical protein